MFYNCISLISLNLTNFNISQVLYMDSMFSGCSSLISLNLPSNFNSFKVSNMNLMFFNCSSLTSLNLSLFKPLCNNMDKILAGCNSLSYLDLSNINSELIPIIQKSNLKLTYINFIDEINNLTNINTILNILEKNAVLCFHSTDNSSFLNLQNSECRMIYCSKDWRIIRKKINTENDECVKNCQETNYKFEYDGKCYFICPQGTKTVKSYENLCEKICPQEFPFLMIDEQKCVSNCNIKDIIAKKCVIHLKENSYSRYNEENMMLINLLNEIKNNFETENIKEKGSISIEENEVIFEIKTMDYLGKNNSINNEIGQCKNILRSYYNISEIESIYLFNIYIKKIIKKLY